MNISEIIKNFIRPSKRLETGYLYFIILIILIEIFLSFNSSYLMEEKKYDLSKFENEIKEFRASKIKKESRNSKQDYYIKKEIAKYDTLELFNFNPNNATLKELQALGLSKKQSQTILNYRKKGGSFRIKDDLSKIYSISEIQFQKLKQYILLPDELIKLNTNQNNTQNNEYELFQFNPNTASRNDFLRLGLSDKQINIIDNYLSKGGKFKTKKDFKKIYSISEKDYLRLENYIIIEDELKIGNTNTIEDNEKKIEKVVYTADLNNSSLEDLIKVKGIGKYSAKKIIEYRTKLGGFVNIEQLKEIHGIYENNYLISKEFLTIDLSKIQKINLNFTNFKELIQHPYLEKVDVVKILKFRDKKGKINNIKELLDKKILSKALFYRIEPYIKI